MKKTRLLFVTLLSALALLTLGACNNTGDDAGPTGSVTPSPSPGGDTHEVVYGLPQPAVGHYIKDTDLIEDDGIRYLLYTTNEESGEEDNVIAVRKAAFTEGKGWAYGDEVIAVRGDANGWDKNIGSASLTKGEFKLNGTSYPWLMAYCATSAASDTQYEIGLAVADKPDGAWTKVSDKPIVEFDGAVYGSSSVGCYAPSLVNMDKRSAVRIFYTYADMYGHFAKFIDISAADVGKLYTDEAKTDVTLISGSVQVPTNGDIAGGDVETMFPNADFAYDAASKKIYAVKDYSPSAGTVPMYAEKIELTAIAEEELYTADILAGWSSIRLWDTMDTPDMAYERLYGACIVSDGYGHILSGNAEIVYNVCETADVNEDWMFTQKLLTFEQEWS